MKYFILTILLLNQPLNFELAVNEKQKAHGLMHRSTWGQNTGMLFVYETPQRVHFWMKNTYLNMKLIYLDKDLNILEIYNPTPLSTRTLSSVSTNVLYVLELNPLKEDFLMRNYKAFRPLFLKQITAFISTNSTSNSSPK